MATYIIGDVHGCYETLCQLLELIEFDVAGDRVLMTGDLVNGGPDSVSVVRWARENGARTVLGNHDLHLLAVAAGTRKPRKNDTFLDLLEADDRDELLSWLRHSPLLIREDDFLLVHAGLLPEWDEPAVLRLAAEAEQVLRASGEDDLFFREMYGDEPRHWRERLEGMDRIRVIINAMTRMRMLSGDGGIDSVFKGRPEDSSPLLCPWYAIPGRATARRMLVFGHWAALGLHRDDYLLGLDTGCVWGGKLTAWRREDGRLFQVDSEMSEVGELRRR